MNNYTTTNQLNVGRESVHTRYWQGVITTSGVEWVRVNEELWDYVFVSGCKKYSLSCNH